MALATWALRAPGILLLASTLLAASVPNDCVGCNLANANLHGADLRNVNYVGTNLSGADLTNADLRNGKFTGANFHRARLAGALLTGAGFIGANFSDIDLHGENLTGASFIGSNFAAANLAGARFDGDNVVGANLRDANLDRTSFRNADVCWINDGDEGEQTKCIELGGASVRGADFTGAKFCRHTYEHREWSCKPVDATTLRTLSHNDLAGATLP